VKPDNIRSLDDFTRRPFTTAKDQQDGYPLPLRSVPFKDIVRIHASSGTTGKRKVLLYTQKDIDDWDDFFARCYEMAALTKEDRAQLPVGYGVWKKAKTFDAFGWLVLLCRDAHMSRTRENSAVAGVRYYGYYSNVSRGKRRKQDQDEWIPCILEPVESLQVE